MSPFHKRAMHFPFWWDSTSFRFMLCRLVRCNPFDYLRRFCCVLFCDTPIPYGLQRPTRGLTEVPSAVHTKRYLRHDCLARIRFLPPPSSAARTVCHPTEMIASLLCSCLHILLRRVMRASLTFSSMQRHRFEHCTSLFREHAHLGDPTWTSSPCRATSCLTVSQFHSRLLFCCPATF